VSGSYVSFFAPDVTTIRANKAIAAAYNKAYPGGTSPFGAPTTGRADLLDGCDAGVQGRQDHPHRAPPGGREGDHRLDAPRREDGVHSERRRRRREVLRVQDRRRQVQHRLLALPRLGAVVSRDRTQPALRNR
jgi:hypothetical protein